MSRKFGLGTTVKLLSRASRHSKFSVFTSAGVPLVHFPVRPEYLLAEVREALVAVRGVKGEAAAGESPAAPVAVAAAPAADAAAVAELRRPEPVQWKKLRIEPEPELLT